MSSPASLSLLQKAKRESLREYSIVMSCNPPSSMWTGLQLTKHNTKVRQITKAHKLFEDTYEECMDHVKRTEMKL